MDSVVLQAVVVLLAGLVAGTEFIVRYGVQPALRRLDDRAHIAARVALVRSLRVVVPGIMIPTALACIVMLVVRGAEDGAGFRWAGVAAFAVFMLSSFLGTVPINMKVIEWRADNPPADWKSIVLRWQRIDVLRSTAAIAAFLCFVVALAMRVP